MARVVSLRHPRPSTQKCVRFSSACRWNGESEQKAGDFAHELDGDCGCNSSSKEVSVNFAMIVIAVLLLLAVLREFRKL
jgi:hypothetical protein